MKVQIDWARLHQSQLRKGKDFRVIRPTIAVCFVNTPLFPEIGDYHLIFELRERRRRTLFTDQMAVHILELTKFNKTADELKTPLDRWLYFLRHAANLDINALPIALDVPEVRWALGDLRMISRSKRERERYESRLKGERDVYTALAEKLDEGRAEERRELIRYLQKRLSQRVTPPAELQALSMPELAKLVKRLQAELDKRLANGS